MAPIVTEQLHIQFYSESYMNSLWWLICAMSYQTSCEYYLGLKQLAGFLHQPWKMYQTSCEYMYYLGLKQLAGFIHQPWKMHQTSCEYYL